MNAIPRARAAFAARGFCLLALVAFVSCKGASKPAPAGSDAAADSGGMDASSVGSVPNGMDGGACDGPTFEFGDNAMLAWTTAGTLVRQGTHFALDLGLSVRFTSSRLGGVNARWVALACEGCSPSDWTQFEAKLGELVGRRVWVRGIVRPGWLSGSDAAPTPEGTLVRLGIALNDFGLVVPPDAGAKK